jgi:hypothetical protein
LAQATFTADASADEQPVQVVVGKWEFSFNGTDVIEEWPGVTIPYP